MKQESDSFQIESELKWEEAGVGVERQIMGYNNEMMMVKVRFISGAVAALHTHPHTQLTYVVSGVFQFITDGGLRVVRPGDGVYMKPDTRHGCMCLEDGVLIDTFSPVRKDFLGECPE